MLDDIVCHFFGQGNDLIIKQNMRVNILRISVSFSSWPLESILNECFNRYCAATHYKCKKNQHLRFLKFERATPTYKIRIL